MKIMSCVVIRRSGVIGYGKDRGTDVRLGRCRTFGRTFGDGLSNPEISARRPAPGTRRPAADALLAPAPPRRPGGPVPIRCATFVAGTTWSSQRASAGDTARRRTESGTGSGRADSDTDWPQERNGQPGAVETSSGPKRQSVGRR